MHRHLPIFRLWLCYTAGMVCFGWLLSWAGAFRYMGIAAIALLIGCMVVFRKSFSRIESGEKRELGRDLIFPPFLILLALITLAGTLYITNVLDSLSYRIPRMLMWLQEGKIHFIDNPDFRMNFMSPFWEFVSTPIYQAAGLRFLWLGSAISWCLLYFSFLFLASHAGVERRKLRWIALIPTASVGFVLQATSTMNDIWAASLISISLCFILSFEKEKRFGDMVASGLALALAANGKAHYAVLALPWLIWFFASKSKPLRSVRWAWAVPITLLVLLCSPLPTFVSNHIYYGSFKGPAGDEGFGLGGPLLNLTLGSAMMLWQLFQPPINPFARKLENLNASWIESTGVAELAPRFSLGSRELSMVDSASIGLVVGILLCLGLIRAFRRRQHVPRWLWFSAVAGLAGFLIAVSQVVPGTLGRSFLGLTVPAIPLCLWGLNHFSRKQLVGAAIFTLVAATAGIVASPSHPLWPAKTIITSTPRLSEPLGEYLVVQERGYAGKKLLDALPPGIGEIGVLPTHDQSLVHLWKVGNTTTAVRFFGTRTTIDQLYNSPPSHFLLIGSPSKKDHYYGLAESLQSDPRFTAVGSQSFVSKLQRGKEPWTVYRKN
jgi:hypothetical protein